MERNPRQDKKGKKVNPVDISLPPGAEISNYLYPEMDLDDLGQDMLSVRLPSGYYIDVGWYPENDPDGQFVVRVFWAYWDNQQLTSPVRTKNLSQVVLAVESLAEHFSKPQVTLSRSGSSPLVRV